MSSLAIRTYLKNVEPMAGTLAKVFAVLMVASTDYNTLLQNISMIAAIVFFLFSGNVRERLKTSFANPVVQAFLLLFAFLCFTALISDNPSKLSFNGVHKYGKFLYGLFLIPIFSDVTVRARAIQFFIAAISVLVGLMFLKQFGMLSIGPAGVGGQIFRNHITHGFILSLAIFFLMHLSFETKNKGYMALLVVMLFAQFAINDGRIGYMVTVALIALFMWQRLSLKQTAYCALLTVALIGSVFFSSQRFHDQVMRTIVHTHAFQAKNDNSTSVGIRLDFWRNVPTIIAQHPFAGVGIGGFRAHYNKQFPDRPSSHFDHPHNSFLLVGAESGVTGLLLFLFFLATAWRMSYTLEAPANYYCQGLLLAFIVGGLSEVVYFRSPTGYTIVFFLSLCLGASQKNLPSLKQLWIKQKKLDTHGQTPHSEFQ